MFWAAFPLGLVALAFMAFSGSSSSYRTDVQRVTVSEVVAGDFQDMIAIQGMVEPIVSMLIDASEGGVVEEIFVEDGATVVKGDPLLRLSNASLSLDFMNRETQIVEQINNLRSTRISLDQTKRQVQEQMLDVDFQLKETERQWKIDSSLVGRGVISVDEFKSSTNDLHYLRERKKLLNERYTTDEKYRQSQLHNIDASVEMMERNLSAIKANLENLVVKAPTDGQLNSFDHEIGQTKSRGQNLGRIDRLDGYRVSAQVDQYYLNRLQVGQVARVNLSGQEFVLRIDKVLPTIVNNQFEIILTFQGDLPPTIRRGQNLPLKLELSAKTKSVMLKKGAFYQSTGGAYVFVLNPEGEAEKRHVTFGAQNPTYYQVLSGLASGEKVITSSYEAFGEAERIILNNYTH